MVVFLAVVIAMTYMPVQAFAGEWRTGDTAYFRNGGNLIGKDGKPYMGSYSPTPRHAYCIAPIGGGKTVRAYCIQRMVMNPENGNTKYKAFKGKGFYWFNKGIGSKNPIDYYVQVEGYDFVDACYKVLDVMQYEHKSAVLPLEKEKTSNAETEYRKFEAPERAENDKRAYAYLVKTRHIAADIVSDLMKKGVIYQSKEYNNVVFLGYDYENKPASAFKRSTQTQISKTFSKCEQPGSDKRYRFRIENGSDVVNVFEAEIDLLSYLTLQDKDERKENYLALGGISEKALDEYLMHRKVREINVCTDNDIAGDECYQKIKNRYAGKYKVTRELPINKDFNEDLSEGITYVKRKTTEQRELEY